MTIYYITEFDLESFPAEGEAKKNLEFIIKKGMVKEFQDAIIEFLECKDDHGAYAPSKQCINDILEYNMRSLVESIWMDQDDFFRDYNGKLYGKSEEL